MLRDRRCFGLKFRRQQVVRGYVVDFYCAELRLAIEIDGPIHEELHRAEQDLARALQIVNEANVLMLRIPARLVTEDNLRKVLLPLSRFGSPLGPSYFVRSVALCALNFPAAGSSRGNERTIGRAILG